MGDIVAIKLAATNDVELYAQVQFLGVSRPAALNTPSLAPKLALRIASPSGQRLITTCT